MVGLFWVSEGLWFVLIRSDSFWFVLVRSFDSSLFYVIFVIFFCTDANDT